jgi:methylated-DNA-[protein]-cysteine S-methyltransferase
MPEQVLSMPFGPGALRVCTAGGAVVGTEFTRRFFRGDRSPSSLCAEDRLLAQALAEIEEYLAGVRRTFELPIRFPEETTAFQAAAWHTLLEIPYGTVVTYGDMAERLRTSPRAVGSAVRRNPLPLLVPCHRVVAKEGLGGFGGTRLVDFKAFLLSLEKAGGG